ncbi:MAG: DNA replication and repair protein RecF [Flavobacteriia bacterium]|nr:DNA replication and repair protein RecF [Flavobacteriia bacterium]
MQLTSLSLTQFKNYKHKEFHFFEDVVCFVGKNGSGKTNVLDAIHYLSTSKSFIQTVDKNNIHFGENFFLIQGTFEDNKEKNDILCVVKIGQKKIIKKNKAAFEKLSDFVGQFPSVIISPYDRDLISEGSEIRRKWMDSIISQCDRNYLDNLIRYNKILDQRNALLKQFYENGYFDKESLALWDNQLIQFGESIYQERKKFIEEFVEVFHPIYSYISSGEDKIELSYKSQLDDKSFSELLIEHKKKDTLSQHSTVGIHKDDLHFLIHEHPIKKYGSQGQQKSFLISLRLAQYEWLSAHLQKKPILLLDDIFDKLDSTRVNKLLLFVSQHQYGQIFITDTEKDRVNTLLNGLSFRFNIYDTEEELIPIVHEER